MRLSELTDMLRQYADAELTLAEVHSRLLPVLAADPLDVAASDGAGWESAPDDERLFWRVVYLLEQEHDDTAELRVLAGRITRSLESTRSASSTHELLPMVIDQDRLCTVVERYARGIVSRTGWISFVTECGYPAHAKLWLGHASPEALGRLCGMLAAGRYDAVAATLERAPGQA